MPNHWIGSYFLKKNNWPAVIGHKQVSIIIQMDDSEPPQQQFRPPPP